MSEFLDAARTVPFPIWIGIVAIAGLVWLAFELVTAPVERDEFATCESCGALATVELADGSLWCGDCDAGAREFDARERRERRERIRSCARAWGGRR